jgi:SAM-dependent methyltransferase
MEPKGSAVASFHPNFTLPRRASVAFMSQDASRSVVLHRGGGIINFFPMQSVTEKFLFAQILRLDPSKTKAILDYGCGRGAFVRFLHERGYRAFGADIEGFWEEDFESFTDRELFSQRIIRVIRPDGSTDFQDHSFDIVVCDHVVEHTDDKDRLFASVHRLLKADGAAFFLFPVTESVRESHIKQFFIHWLPKGGLRYRMALLQKKIGIGGENEPGASDADYVRVKLHGIDTNTHYETFRRIRRRMERFFDVEAMETDYLARRLPDSAMGFLSPLLKTRLLKRPFEAFFRIYSFAVVKATPRVN